jgi:GntR family transcriptional regulator/MocR family aminotransferase
MRPWTFPLALDARSDTPIFLQIARAIAADVRRGRLRAGDALPGSRELARTLGVHRNTVVAAYEELGSQGWLQSRQRAGTVVAATSPDARPRAFARSAAPRAAVPDRVGFDLPPRAAPSPILAAPPGALPLNGGVPDVRLAPVDALGRAYRRALRREGGAMLGYGDPRGVERLRAGLAGWLSQARGLAAPADAVLVTRGSQMAFDVVARTLIGPGDVVAVEALGYRAAWAAFAGAGARLVPVPVDARGLDVAALAAIADRTRLRAVYVTPHHQYPTMAVLHPERRIALLDLAARARVAIVEDDYDHEFHYEGRPVLPLASGDTRGVVVYVGTLSKLLAPAVRIGFVVAPTPLVERLTHVRVAIDRQGDGVVEAAVAELIEDGELARHARRARKIYLARRDALASRLRRELGGALSFAVPRGGLALWAEVDPSIDVERWYEAALARGVAFAPGRHFQFDGKRTARARLGFAACDEEELARAVDVLRRTLPAT